MPPVPDPDHPPSRLLFSHTLDIVLDTVLHFLPSRCDRGAVSLVSRSWHAAEARTRREVFVGNCYAVSPSRATRRFPNAIALVVKGRPRFADFSLVPPGWGAGAGPWVTAASGGFRWLERVCFKRMSVTDEDLGVVARAFAGFKEICLVCCEGFGGAGLASVAANCRQLRVLDLIDDEVEDDGVDWISKFSEKTTFLESLMFDCVTSEVNFQALESLVARSPRLKKLRVNYHVTSVQLCRLMARAPQLTHLGTGSFRPVLGETSELGALVSAFSASNSLVCLSGFHDIVPDFLPAIYPVCGNLTSLNLSYAEITGDQLKPAVANCHNLQKFWALDSVGDEGLVAVAAACVDLRELRIFPINAQEDSESAVSDVGLTAISTGCQKLRSILYFCQRMTNDAVVAMSINCPDLIVFRLCIMGLHRPDRLSGLPMDEGFGAIVKNCKKLTRLAVSGWLTDKAFEYIGLYGKLLRTLSVAFAGNSDVGLKYVLEGCPRLQKLEIRDSPFGDSGFLSGLHHYYNMRFLWMSSCKLSLRGCKEVAWRLPRMVVEVIRDVNSESKIHENDEDCQPIEKLYMYRSLAGPRTDAPPFVTIL